MDTRVCAVVVTYNRLALLKECIESLMSQSYRNFDIVVVNNGSTDGTKDYIDSVEHVIPIHQDNLGGAGGFYAGMKYASEHDYDAAWLMDDDGVCDKDELKNLLFYADKYHLDVANALVVSKEDSSRLYDGSSFDCEQMANKEVVIGKTRAFNGTLIRKSVLEKIGFVKKELFIYGDDREYIARVDKYGLKRGTVLSAIHYHPDFKGEMKWLIPCLHVGKVYEKSGKFEPFFYRNLGYLYAEYKTMSWLKYFLYYLSRLDFNHVRMILHHFNQGRKGIFDLNNTI